MSKPKIQMVDLKSQYNRIKPEIDRAIQQCLDHAVFINGEDVKVFQQNLADYLDVKHVITCANGTDALQIAMMALDLQQGDEVICPAFTYVATAEVIGLLGLKPIMVDVHPDTFNIDVEAIEKRITSRTKAIVPVHLYGQSADMEALLDLAEKHGLYIIEDNAQALGATYRNTDGTIRKTGTIGHIGCTSFFPSKNLGCFGDGGALMTNDDDLAVKIRMIANHGQAQKYHHEVLGCNSRLDTLQAAILNVKLPYLEEYAAARNRMAEYYDDHLADLAQIKIPKRSAQSSHVFHQYTIRVQEGSRDQLKSYLAEQGIPSMVYYPLPLYRQKAFLSFVEEGFSLPHTEQLCKEVLSLPIHTEYDEETLEYIVGHIIEFFFKHAKS